MKPTFSSYCVSLVFYPLFLSTSGCIGVEPARVEPDYQPSYGFVEPVEEATDGAIYLEGRSPSKLDETPEFADKPLISDPKTIGS